jgi:type VI secretion system protein ImpL
VAAEGNSVTIKSLLSILVLSLGLVWAWGALYHSADLVHFGLFWTIVILASVLAIVVGVRLFGLWRVWRAKAASRPAPPQKTAPAIHEDDAALAALLAEASAALGKSSNYAGVRGKAALSRLPLYLLIGPSGVGKTSTFLNSGIEPQLLAGEEARSANVSTRLCNIWLAKNAVFVEVSGRIFAGEMTRWNALLAVLQGKPPLPFWRRIWQEPDGGLRLQGVLGFCDVKELTGAGADPQRLERVSRDWHERLMAIAEVFGTGVPVYQVLTKCDAIPFFSDFFSRLPESEVSQILGCTLSIRKAPAVQPAEGFAETESKRLTAAFRPLYQALAERRISHLVHEPNPARKPGIYEFPRELKRIRQPLVQFLTDAFRPNPLRPAAVLRGFYLTAVQEVEAAVAAPPTEGDWTSPNLNLETTRLFRGEATQLFNAGDGAPARSRKGMRLRWIFVSDLLHQVVVPDRPLLAQPAVKDVRFERTRRAVLAGACGAGVLLCCAFVTSWASNRSLLNDVADASRKANIKKHDTVAALSDLQALEGFRKQVERLQDGESLHYRWGLYTGNTILDEARKTYFAKFQELLLVDLNAAMLVQLRNLTTTPTPDDPEEPTFDFLKTHLMISSDGCKRDPDLALRTLKRARALVAPEAPSEWQELADRQIAFYGAALKDGNPCKLPEDIAARDHARHYLAGIRNTDRFYQAMLAEADKSVTKPKQLADLASNYGQVLQGNGEVRAAFSLAGWVYVQNASKKAVTGRGMDDSCVLGDTPGLLTELKQGSAEKNIQQRFIQDYIDQWHKFLVGLSVIPYKGAADAVQKLGFLSDHNSPLLAVMALTAEQTNFSTPIKTGMAKEVEKGVDFIKGSEKKLQHFTGAEHQIGILDITKAFQPAQYVVPPGSDRWINDKNSPYINALTELQNAIRAMSRASSDTPPDPQAGQNAADKAEGAVRQIQQGFIAEGTVGVDLQVARLLEEPITLAQPYITPPSPAGKVTSEWQKFCVSIQPMLSKYPFNAAKAEDQEATLKELQDVFAPEQGSVWKLQKSSLADITILEGGSWKANPAAQKIKASPELLDFLNRAQQLRKGFFADGPVPHLTYNLRSRFSEDSKQQIQLKIDGQAHDFDAGHQRQHQFLWPAASGATAEASGRSGVAGASSGFSAHEGRWAVFRFFGDAAHREADASVIQWTETKSGTGHLQALEPPVQLEFVGGFPGGVDVFNPGFYKGFRCSFKPVQ